MTHRRLDLLRTYAAFKKSLATNRSIHLELGFITQAPASSDDYRALTTGSTVTQFSSARKSGRSSTHSEEHRFSNTNRDKRSGRQSDRCVSSLSRPPARIHNLVQPQLAGPDYHVAMKGLWTQSFVITQKRALLETHLHVQGVT